MHKNLRHHGGAVYIHSMIKNMITKNLLKLVALGTPLFFAGCAEFNDPYYPSSPSRGYSNSYDNDDYYRNRERDRIHHDKHELDRERDRIENERRQLEEQRRRERDAYRPPPPREDRCPSGFSPSEQKCSSDERRRGCRDVRLPSGLGCVSR